ncbi:N-acetylmuramoyl-L-alanine amidase [Marinicrinis lubricantis]|uniref:N-acetylmuramoyl-L-alanine amidase n=1 Tax=Marinicrinis lubricantis TaxID=2086470 RepID=A0ABW1ILU8_9BACL
MKKTCGWLVLLSLLWLILPRAAAADEDAAVSLYVNGRQASVSDTPQIIHKVPYLSSRDIEANIGAEVEIDASSSQIVLKKSGNTSILSTAADAGSGPQEAVPFKDGERWFIPLAALEDDFDMKVLWDPLTSSIFVYLSEGVSYENSGTAIPDVPSVEDTAPNPDSSQEVIVEPNPTEPSVEDTQDHPDSITDVPVIPSDGQTVIAGFSFAEDVLSIQTNGYAMVEHFALSDPARIVVDISHAVLSPDLTSGQSGGTIASTHAAISQIRYSQTGDAVRLVLDMNQRSAYSLQTDANKIDISFQAESYVVVIDPGHGGKDPGAPSMSGKSEKDFNLSTATHIAQALAEIPGVVVHLTRSTDDFIELAERGEIANRLNADLFISVHGNTVDKPVSGIETYYWHRESFDVASLIHQKIVNASGLNDRNVRRNDWKVLTTAQMPGVLLELGYLSSSVDEPVMWTEEYQQSIADAVAETVKEYFQIET